MPRARRTASPVRLSTTWRTAIAAGSRIAVRLIAAFQARRRRTWPSIAARAWLVSSIPSVDRAASKAA
jgi:hypothetical protein